MVSANKERYIWEIYLSVREEGYARVSNLAKALEISVPSASKMVKKLNEEELVDFQRYGMITLTDRGMEVGERLAVNHDILARFFRFINVDEEAIETEVNKVEFYIGGEVIQKIEQFLGKVKCWSVALILRDYGYLKTLREPFMVK